MSFCYAELVAAMTSSFVYTFALARASRVSRMSGRGYPVLIVMLFKPLAYPYSSARLSCSPYSRWTSGVNGSAIKVADSA
jgi:hypothetical protein